MKIGDGRAVPLFYIDVFLLFGAYLPYNGGGFAAETKRVDTCGFYPLNSRFPLFLSLAQIADM